jgi:hypothetical protein
MLKLQTRGLQAIVAGCCLLAAATGCHFHRANHGYAVRSLESPEYDDSVRLAAGTNAPLKADEAVASPSQANGTTVSKPEVLPWRSRLRGYRLAGRIFRHEESATYLPGNENCDRTKGILVGGETIPPPPVSLEKTPSETAAKEKTPQHPAKEDKIELPDQALNQPESRPVFSG